MKAQITRSAGYRCAPQGHTVITLPWGAIVEGRIAQAAVDAGAASPIHPDYETKIVSPAETKPSKPRGRPRKVKP